MSSRETVRSASDDLRDRIYRAAVDVVYEKGFSGATMRDIAARSNVQMASIYYHFDSKQKLLFAIMERTLSSSTGFVAERVIKTSADDAASRLRAALEANIEWHATWQREAFITDAELSRLEDGLREQAVAMRDEHEAIVNDIIGQGVASGQFRTADPALVARMLLSSSGGVSSWYRPGQSHDPTMLADVLCSAIVDGLRSPDRTTDSRPHPVREDPSSHHTALLTAPLTAAAPTDGSADGARVETSQRIYDAALDHFYRYGYNGASIRDILADANAKMSSLYHYYDSKQGLLLAVLQRESEAATTMLEQYVDIDAGPLERLRSAIEGHILWHTMRQREAFVTDAELARLEPAYRANVVAVRDRHEQIFRGILEDGVARGVLRPVEIALVVRFILAGATGVSSWYRPSGPHTPTTIARIYSDALLEGLRVTPGS